jgi:hypothetical protein
MTTLYCSLLSRRSWPIFQKCVCCLHYHGTHHHATTRSNIQEGCNLLTRSCENLKSHYENMLCIKLLLLCRATFWGQTDGWIHGLGPRIVSQNSALSARNAETSARGVGMQSGCEVLANSWSRPCERLTAPVHVMTRPSFIKWISRHLPLSVWVQQDPLAPFKSIHSDCNYL